MDAQQKLKSLNNRLEAMNYHYTFTIDSAALIEALLSDLTLLNQSYQRLRSESLSPSTLYDKIEVLTQENLKLEEELQKWKFSALESKETENLNKTVVELRKENSSLTRELAVVRNSKNEAKPNEYLEKLFSECNFLRKRLEETEENSQKLVLENRNLHDRLRNSDNQIAMLKKDLDLTLSTMKGITHENKSTTEEFYSLKQLISSYESKYHLVQNENNSLRIDLERLMQLNKSLDLQLNDANRENLKLRNEIEDLTTLKLRLSSQNEAFQRQLEGIQIENNKILSINQEHTHNSLEQQSKYRNLEKDYQEIKSKLRILYKENQILTEKNNEKEAENRNKEFVKRDLEKEIKDLRVYQDRFEDSQFEIQKLKESLEDASIQLKRAKQENFETSENLKFKQEELRQFRSYLEQAHKEIESLKFSIEEHYTKNETFISCQRNNLFLQDQLKTLKLQCENSVAHSNRLSQDLETLKISLQKSEDKLSYCSRLLESTTTQKSVIEQENQQLKNSVNDFTSIENSQKLEISKLEHKLQNSYSEIEEMKKQFSKNSHQINSLQEDLQGFQKKYLAEQSFGSKQADQIAKLKDLNYSLEVNRTENFKAIEELKRNEREQAELIQRLREEVNGVKKQLSMSEKICAEGVADRESLVTQINGSRYESNRKTDENLSLKNSLRVHIKEIEELKAKNQETYESENHFKRMFRECDIEKSRLFELNHNLTEQVEDLKKTIGKSEIDIQELITQNRAKDCEIKKQEDHRKSLKYEIELLTLRLDENARELRNKSEVSINATHEREDLIRKFRDLHEEHNKLLRAYEYLSLEFKKINSKSFSIENLNESFKIQEENYFKTLKDQEEKLKIAMRNSEILEYKRQEAEKKNENLMKEINSSKSYTREFDSNVEGLQRRIMSLESEKGYLESRFRSMENELEYEKKRASEIERRVVWDRDVSRRAEFDEERAKGVKLSNNDLVSELYKQIEEYKSENVSNEMKYLKLMDEFSKTKSQLHQAEMRLSEFDISRR